MEVTVLKVMILGYCGLGRFDMSPDVIGHVVLEVIAKFRAGKKSKLGQPTSCFHAHQKRHLVKKKTKRYGNRGTIVHRSGLELK